MSAASLNDGHCEATIPVDKSTALSINELTSEVAAYSSTIFAVYKLNASINGPKLYMSRSNRPNRDQNRSARFCCHNAPPARLNSSLQTPS